MKAIDRINSPRINDLPGLAAIYCSSAGVWGGVDNLSLNPDSEWYGHHLIKNKDDAFKRLNFWKSNEASYLNTTYVCGFVADFDMKILYYDDAAVIDFLKDPKYGQEYLDYFVVLIKLDPPGKSA